MACSVSQEFPTAHTQYRPSSYFRSCQHELRLLLFVCVCTEGGGGGEYILSLVACPWLNSAALIISAVCTAKLAYVGGSGMRPLQESKPESVIAECVHCFG